MCALQSANSQSTQHHYFSPPFFTFFHHDSLGLQKISQSSDFLLQLSDQLGIAVLVHHRLAHNLLRSGQDQGQVVSETSVLAPVGISESGEGLVVVDVCWGDGGQHGSLRVPAKVLPEQPGEDGVPEGNVVALLLLPLGVPSS